MNNFGWTFRNKCKDMIFSADMGLILARRTDLYKLDWQAGLIYTLAGSNQTNATTFDRQGAIASLKNLFAVPAFA